MLGNPINATNGDAPAVQWFSGNAELCLNGFLGPSSPLGTPTFIG
jgi:hypothetical protein